VVTRSAAGTSSPSASEGRSGVTGLEAELTLLARHTLHTSQHAPDRCLDRSGYQLLGRLEHGPLSLKQLAEAFRLDQSTVNRQVNALRRGGLVRRIADPDGGTALLIEPTAQGRAALRRDRHVAHRQLGDVLADWSEADIEHLHAMLEKFNVSIENLEGRPWPRP